MAGEVFSMKDPEGKIRVGMGGWQLEPFNGPLYPANSPKGFRKLEHYSRFFDVVEVNATFYTNALTPRNAYQWMQDVSGNPGFKFSVKLFKAFTHSMDATRGDVKSIHRLLEPMAAEERLCGLVMQFPYSFVFNDQNRAHLTKLGKAFSEFRLFVEVRHNSWNVPEVHAFLQGNNLHLVNVDLPKIKKHMPLTDTAWGDTTYFRFMGRNAEMWDHGSSGGSKKDGVGEREISLPLSKGGAHGADNGCQVGGHEGERDGSDFPQRPQRLFTSERFSIPSSYTWR